ncbi:MAG: polyprenyl synthetase family protein [Candidatus Binataceae bacterium]
MRHLKPNRAASAKTARRSSSFANRGAAASEKAFAIGAYLNSRKQLVEQALDRAVPEADGPAARLHEAMRYSLMAGGKRLRPVLALAACEAAGGRIEDALGLACAVEMIHTYSMIHDDLPCMDDDDLRRGRPANHKVFGEAIATLAGDALLTHAFAVLVRFTPAGVSPAILAETIARLAEAAGSPGMVGGQTIDLLSEGQNLTVEQLKYLHSLKTGALFAAAIVGGGRLGGATGPELAALDDYARALGLAFQVVDDLLDVEASTEQMGKRTHKDENHGKATYPAILGVEKSRRFARQLERAAHGALDIFNRRADPLRELASFAVERKL